MAWERGYYYRSRKVAGRVVREYLCKWTAAQVIAKLDADRRRADRARATEAPLTR